MSKKIIVAFDPVEADIKEAKILQELKDREYKGDIIIIGVGGDHSKTMYIDKEEAVALEAEIREQQTPSWLQHTDIGRTTAEPIIIRDYPYLEPYVPTKKRKRKTILLGYSRKKK